MNNDQNYNQSHEPVLLGINACIEAVFPDKEGRPCRRTFDEWRSRGFIPQITVGRRVFLDPQAVRKALIKRFGSNA
ncbi:hypothetical protein SAMN02745181_1271 [Rubritalea squalenifaciens DSM 18772]|uniref:Helix-turn-helix domain-containing protein n=1 Tax=Rubritalea squalenifaciens DSM 18772 TaxID=1123071 RepID=A0A1M6GUF6_9BACT|nr:hypothetical protein [Rubritalea squalenifaciens]SHJ13572.1 hypothetical protein SAMN02745181_1271 [Rubritalea squalenifaciens DSM 18772]